MSMNFDQYSTIMRWYWCVLDSWCAALVMMHSFYSHIYTAINPIKKFGWTITQTEQNERQNSIIQIKIVWENWANSSIFSVLYGSVAFLFKENVLGIISVFFSSGCMKTKERNCFGSKNKLQCHTNDVEHILFFHGCLCFTFACVLSCNLKCHRYRCQMNIVFHYMIIAPSFDRCVSISAGVQHSVPIV